MNKVNLTGRIANDLDMRMTQSGKAVLSFNIAVKKETKDENGNYQADFFRITAWEQCAKFLEKYAQKGTLIGVSGKLETNSYTNKYGNNVTDTYIKADQVEILSAVQKKEAVQQIRVEQTNSGAEITGMEELDFY